MSKKYVGTNKGSTTVAANFNATATAFTVATGEGVRLPAPTGGDYTLLVLQNTAGVREIICVVGRTGDVCTVGIPGSAAANVAGRNYEAIYGMAAASWVIGDVVSVRPTAELIEAGVNFGDSIAAATNKVTPVDADTLALSDSEASNASSKLTWANLKAAIQAALIPTGTKMLFQQTTAPTGWTKDLVHNDKALRVVSGTASSGGTTAFSTIFAKTVTDSHTLATAEIPAHSHGVTDPGHLHTYGDSTAVAGSPIGGGSYSSITTQNTSSAATGISINNAGGGGGHTHGMDIRVQYVDLIIATKN